MTQTKFSFGATSAIITNLGLITGLDKLAHPQLSIITGILIIAVADNIADSAGIHIYQESECLGSKEVWFSTLSNFLTRILVSLAFIFLIVSFPLKMAVFASVVLGLFLLAIMSYSIAKNRGTNPYLSIIEHISIAVLVIIASHFASQWIAKSFAF